jgi:hypothetical protein
VEQTENKAGRLMLRLALSQILDQGVDAFYRLSENA